MRQAEGTHWWYRTLRRLVALRLRTHLAPADAPLVLDAGCGTGGGLERWAHVVGARCFGIDLSADALSHCLERGETLIAQASVTALPFADRSFGAVVSLDVLCLEGVDEDLALAEINRVLRPGGILVMNLPAFEALRGQHDLAVRIRRRFSRGDVEHLLRTNGFDIRETSYWNVFFFPIVWLARRVRRGRGPASSDLAPVPEPLNTVLAVLLRVETKLAANVRMPFGTSVICAARKS